MNYDLLQLLVDKAIIAYDAYFTVCDIPEVYKKFTKTDFDRIINSVPIISRNQSELIKEIKNEVDALIFSFAFTIDNEPFCDPKDFEVMYKRYCKSLNEKWKGELE